jgi:hypothetical protein
MFAPAALSRQNSEEPRDVSWICPERQRGGYSSYSRFRNAQSEDDASAQKLARATGRDTRKRDGSGMMGGLQKIREVVSKPDRGGNFSCVKLCLEALAGAGND